MGDPNISKSGTQIVQPTKTITRNEPSAKVIQGTDLRTGKK